MYKNALERNRREAAEGIVPTAFSVLRVQAEFEILAERQGLSIIEAQANLVAFLHAKNMTVGDFQRLPDREKFILVRESFAN